MSNSQYEVVLVVDAALTDSEATVVLDKHKEIITKAGGQVVKESGWGRRKLAYEVKKKKQGIYFLLYIDANGAIIEEMERQFGYDDQVLKHFAIKVDSIDHALDNFESLKQNPLKNAQLITESVGV